MRIDRIPVKDEEPQVVESEIDLSLLDELIQRFRNKPGNMIPLLQGTQNLYGYLPRDAFYKISRETGLSLSEMYGVATFYAQFRLQPVGKHIIKVCHGTACHVQNAGGITDALQEALGVEDGHTTEDMLFTLESVACLGCCSLAPVMMIGEETYGKLDGNAAVKVIKDIRLKEKENGH
ncbi:MAG: NADH-quinone oxidoreductase subunit NuoE [Bacteroidales bacterium]